VDAHGDTHDHVLGAFSDAAVDTQKVGAFKGFETEAASSDE
jgi:hypothetical protein